MIEYMLDPLYSDSEIKETVKNLEHYKSQLQYLLCYPQHSNIFTAISKNFKINVTIDEPLGLGSYTSRLHQAREMLKNTKVSAISMTAPCSAMVNRKYTQIEKEISNINEHNKLNKKIRYILDYRKYSHNTLAQTCQILQANGVECCYPTSGYFLDNVHDAIIAVEFLNRKSGMPFVFNTNNLYTKKQLQLCELIEPYGFSTRHTAFMDVLYTSQSST